MLKRDSKTGRLTKQPAKIGDLVIIFNKNTADEKIGCGFTNNRAYKVVATQMSKEKNRICFNNVYPLREREDKFGVFIIDDNGDKRYLNLGTDIFGNTVEKLPNGDN